MKKTCNAMKKVMAYILITILVISCAPIALAETFSAIVTSSSMTVYKNSSLSTKLGSLKKGTVVLVTDYAGKVAKIKYNGKTGFAPISAMDTVENVAEKAIVNTNSKVFDSAKTTSKYTAVKKGTELYVLAAKNPWAMVEKNGVVGYMNLAHLTIVDDFNKPLATATPKPTAEPTVAPTKAPEITVKVFEAYATEETNVYKSASASSTFLGTLKKGDVVTVGAYSDNGWAYIRLNGKYGYCKYDSLAVLTEATPVPTVVPTITPTVKPTAAPTATPDLDKAIDATVTASKLYVYKTASIASKKLATLSKGGKVNVIQWNGTWAYIETNGTYGYCAVSGLTKTSELQATPTPTVAPTATPALDKAVDATVTASKLYVYKTASVASKKLATLYKGGKVNVIQWNGTWAYIETNGTYGYCAVSGLTKTSELQATPNPTPTPDLSKAVKATVTSDALYVYKTASTTAAKLATLKKGAQVNVISWNGVWAYIEANGKYGFCAVSGLTKTSELQATPNPTPTPDLSKAVKATVTSDALYVYKTASTAAAKLATLKKGTEVNVISWNGVWAYIERGGSYGFCAQAGLTKTSELEKEENKLPAGYVEGGFTATVVSKDAKVYASASTDAKSAALVMGQSVNVYAYSENWALIVQGKEYGFVQTKYLSKTAYETVKENGDAIHTILKALLTYGYYDQIPSTTYNTAAATAIKLFQKDCGLTQSGEADQATQRILFSDYAPRSSVLSKKLSSGDKGTNVTRMQTRLYALGYLSKTTSVDSDFGATTKNAVKLFQNANGITPSGEADIATLKELYSTGAIKKPSNIKAADATSSSSGGATSGTSWTLEMPSSLASFTTSPGSTAESKIEYVIYIGQQQLGKPYVWGAEGPDKYDCSGFTQYCFGKVGITLKRSAYSQGTDKTYEKITSPGSLKRGDLVFFNTITDTDLSDHAGIYLGKGYFIHASSGGAKVVVSNLNSGYYSRVFSWGHRPIQ